MDEKNWMEVIMEQTQIKQILDTNEHISRYGLVLTQEDAAVLAAERRDSLKKAQRVELGQGILPRLITVFCDSEYIHQDNFRDTLVDLQEIFFLYKNEMMDEITDEELLNFMKEQFDGVCYGDLDYLAGTCLEIFAQAIRAGYQGYHQTDGRGEYSQFDPVTRWDRGLYLLTLSTLTDN